MADLFSPEIKPGETYRWTYPERLAQMGKFGPASIAEYLGYTVAALIVAVVALNAALAVWLGRGVPEKLVFLVASIPLSVIVALAPALYPYYTARTAQIAGKSANDDAWMARWLLRGLIGFAFIASTLFVLEQLEPGLVPSLDDLFPVFPVKQEVAKREETRQPRCDYVVPFFNASANLARAEAARNLAQSWCDGAFFGLFRRDPRACYDLPTKERAVAEAQAEFDCARREYRAKPARATAQRIELDAPRWTASAIRHALFAIIAMGFLQVAAPIFILFVSESRKGIMLERFDAPAPVVIRTNGDIPISPMPPGAFDTFAEWSGERIIPNSAARGLRFNVIYDDYDLWCLNNGYKDQRLNVPAFQDRLKVYIKSIQGAKRHSGGSVYDGLQIA